MISLRGLTIGLLAMLGCIGANANETAAALIRFSIESQPIDDALLEFSRQTGVQIVFDSREGRDIVAPEVSGAYTPEVALQRLLRNSGLRYEYLNKRTVAVQAIGPRQKPVAGETTAARIDAGRLPLRVVQLEDGATSVTEPAHRNSRRDDDEEQVAKGVPEILVKSRRSLNTDIPRTEDDVQPYVVLDREQIEHSMAPNVEELLKSRLPMNAMQRTISQIGGSGAGNQSSVNLRGLGPHQTLILVDGRRMPSTNTGERFVQADINGIPLSAIERIEVLPSTASGIYGGGATGGVVNIITRKDYAGMDLAVTYGNTFASDVANRRLDASAGFSLEEGRTRVLLTASHADTNPLTTGERDLTAAARALQQRNNPAVFYSTASAPPQGYTSNIRSQDGSNLVLDGGAALNSSFTSVPVGYAGPASDGGAAFLANAGRYNVDLPQDGNGTGRSLLANPTVTSAAASLRRDFGARLDAYADLMWLNNESNSYWSGTQSVGLPADAPANPFATDILVSFPSNSLQLPTDSDSTTVRATAGAILRLPRNWMASAEYLWSRSRHYNSTTTPAIGDPDGAGPGLSATQAFESGALDVLRDLNRFPLDYTGYRLASPNLIYGPADTELRQISGRLSGPLLQLPAGALMVSALLERREEQADAAFQDRMSASAVTSAVLYPGRRQQVDAYYLETRLPLISATNAVPFMRELELQASVRRDEYSSVAPSLNSVAVSSRSGSLPSIEYATSPVEATKYTAGLRFSPIEDIALRASIGTGFLPASIDQLVPPAAPFLIRLPLIDPQRGGTFAFVGPFQLTLGGNPDLTPEESRSWSAGIVLTPRALPGARLSVDYTRIRKTNEITTLAPQSLVDLEQYLPGHVTRGSLSATDQALGYTAGPITAMELTFVNLAAARLQAFDIQADYTRTTRGGDDVHFYALATWQPDFERRAVPTAPFVDSAGYTSGPLRWRGNAGLDWRRGAWSLGWNAQFFDAYYVYTATLAAGSIPAAIFNQGAAKIPAQIYHDLFASYRFDGRALRLGSFTDTEIRLGVQNVLDTAPPLVATVNTFEGYSTYADPRMRRYSITVRTRF